MNSQALTHTLTSEARAALDAGDIDTLLALSRARYGGFVMEDEGDADENEDENQNEGEEDEPGNEGEEDDGAEEDARITRANKQAAKYRTDLRKTQTELQKATELLNRLKKAVGGEDDEDPTAKVTAATEKVAGLEAERAALQAELLVTRLAPKHKGNADALLDSQKFTKTLAGLDPEDDDYEQQVAEAIKAAVKQNAAYRAGQGSGKGGSEMDPEKREKPKGDRPKGLGAAISGRYKS